MTYKVESTKVTPEIDFDGNSGMLSIKGKSFWENADSFYGPILSWLDKEYIPNPAEQTKLTIQLDYFNTATAKALLDIFKKLEKVHDDGKTVNVVWRYLYFDEDLQESGEDYQLLTSLPITLEAFEGD